jgi:pimeloyl-ACP methyl ester carboxylesterase
VKKALWIQGRGLLGLAVLLVAGVIVGLSYRAYRQHENAQSLAIHTPGGIDEEQFVEIGGIRQWVVIRGEDRTNPILLYVDGGPGGATSAFSALRGWEKAFTVVQWDQRGAGKTRTESGPVIPGTTIERMAEDGIEVTRYVLSRLKQPKLIVVGASWGSVLGVLMVQAHPDLFHAYVGTGQASDVARGERMGYDRILLKVRERGDTKAVAQLTALGPPPYHRIDDFFAERQWVNGYEAGAQPGSSRFIEGLLYAPRYSLRDTYSWVNGILEEMHYFFGSTMSAPFWRINFFQSAREFKLPVFVIQGAEDDTEPAELARAYVEAIKAPQKKFIPIAGAGHSVSMTFSDQFLDNLVQYVRPLARPTEPATEDPPLPPLSSGRVGS